MNATPLVYCLASLTTFAQPRAGNRIGVRLCNACQRLYILRQHGQRWVMPVIRTWARSWRRAGTCGQTTEPDAQHAAQASSHYAAPPAGLLPVIGSAASSVDTTAVHAIVVSSSA